MRQLIAILRGITPDEAGAVAEVLVKTGFGMIEVPMNSPEPFESISRMAGAVADRAMIGGGTITQEGQVTSLKEAGGTFVVSPNCNADIIRATKAEGMTSYPGVFTATECYAALDNGADGLKLFPASLIGPAGLNAILAALPDDAQIFAVGGVEAAQFGDWIAAGAAGFGVGSALVKPGRDLAQIETAGRSIVAAYDAALAT